MYGYIWGPKHIFDENSSKHEKPKLIMCTVPLGVAPYHHMYGITGVCWVLLCPAIFPSFTMHTGCLFTLMRFFYFTTLLSRISLVAPLKKE